MLLISAEQPIKAGTTKKPKKPIVDMLAEVVLTFSLVFLRPSLNKTGTKFAEQKPIKKIQIKIK